MKQRKDIRRNDRHNRERQNQPNPDDRSNNVARIQKNIGWTIYNMEIADELIAKTSDEKLKHELIKKNERRRKALEGMRKEIRDEAMARQGEDD